MGLPKLMAINTNHWIVGDFKKSDHWSIVNLRRSCNLDLPNKTFDENKNWPSTSDQKKRKERDG